MDFPLQERMGYIECVANKHLHRSEVYNEFPELIVYVKRHERPDGSYTSERGSFHVVYTYNIFLGKDLDDWNLDKDFFENQFGVPVKQVFVTFGADMVFFAATLFCRVKPSASRANVNKILNALNSHLDLYEDNLRYGIAQEWCGQENWRVFPFDASQEAQPGMYLQPDLNVSDIMSHLLPEGYGEEMPSNEEDAA